VAYQPTEEGDFSTTLNLYTNDPNNRLKTVALSGHVFEPNTLILNEQSNPDGTYNLSIALDNYTDIVAVQYDLHWRNDMTTSQSAFVPSARMQNHNAVVTPLDEDSYRIIIYSMSNATIAGHNGELHRLVFTPQSEANYFGSTIYVDNIVLSNAAGSNKTSVDKMVIAVETTALENIPTDVMGVYKVLHDNKIFIIRGGKAYSIMGHLVGDKSVIDPAVTIQ
jgi:hypothetical protein